VQTQCRPATERYDITATIRLQSADGTAVKLAAAVPDWSHAPALSNLCLSPEAAWLSLLLQDAAYFEVRTEQL
jgi:hypothetical protein